MEKGYFITGIDTNAGKTWATVALMRYFKSQGKSVIGMKPVASGCSIQDGILVNEDALLLQQNATVKLGYQHVNPYAYALPVSPHIAGKDNPVELDVIVKAFNVIKDQAQILLVEGAGGWYSPINQHQDNSDLAIALALPVLLVVAIKLGCINHAKLTYQAMNSEDVVSAGWIAVHTEPDPLNADEIVATLTRTLEMPLLGVLPYTKNPDFDGLAKNYSLHSVSD